MAYYNKPSSKKDYVYHELLSQLLNRKYSFGEKLIVKQIGEELGVSKQPIMTALSSLQERGFVTITAQVGCQVLNPSISEVQDFYQMFAANEGIIASLATKRGNKESIKKLKSINSQIKKLKLEDISARQEYRLLNTEFHKQIQEMANSIILSNRQVANYQLSDFFIVQTSGFRKSMIDSYDEHQKIITAIEIGNSEKSKQIAIQHINRVSKSVRLAMEVKT